MVENHNHIDGILEKYARGETLTGPETLLLEEWGSRSERHRQTMQLFGNAELMLENLRSLPAVPMTEIWTEIERRIKEEAGPGTSVATFNRRYRRNQYMTAFVIASALAIVAVVSLLAIFRFSMPVKQSAPNSAAPEAAVTIPLKKQPAPLHEQAVLTRADNSQVILDTVRIGALVSIGYNLSVRKTAADRLVYEANTLQEPAPQGWNCLAIGDRRNPFDLRLPDGSRVLLKPGSELRYPLSRDGEQQVKLGGEAWFDVGRNSQRPMTIATLMGMRVQVLGTCFAIRAWPGKKEPKVSLISGALKISIDTENRLLRPGGEVVLREGRLVEQALKGEAGLFAWADVPKDLQFAGTKFSVVIREIADWYRLKIDNPDNLKGIPVTGVFARDQSPEKVLQEIERVESSAVFLHIDGDRIVISGSPETQ